MSDENRTQSQWLERGIKYITPLSGDTPDSFFDRLLSSMKPLPEDAPDSSWNRVFSSMKPIKEAISRPIDKPMFDTMIEHCDRVVSQVPGYEHGFLLLIRPDK